MKRNLSLVALLVGAGLCLATTAEAQVFVRAPFVRVQVGGGGGVSVRAPFVNLWVPPPPVYYYGPRTVYYMPPAPTLVQPPVAPQSVEPQPVQPQQPAPSPEVAPPQPTKSPQVPTLEQFAASFQPKAGNYEVTLLSPVTNQPTPVRFTLPEGSPRRVHVYRTEIEFNYGFRRFVRIEFDHEGAMVTSR